LFIAHHWYAIKPPAANRQHKPPIR
jgi:hypothetical protein